MKLGYNYSMIIEKKTVIKALQTENLSYGWFFNSKKSKNAEKDCPVCAVGAIIRKSLGRKIGKYTNKAEFGFELNDYCAELTDHLYTDINPEILLKEKNYLGALSSYFESFGPVLGLGDIKVTPVVRKRLIEFAKKNFPTRFKVQDFDELAEKAFADISEYGN